MPLYEPGDAVSQAQAVMVTRVQTATTELLRGFDSRQHVSQILAERR
jgi:hypothetical protein